MRVDRDLGWVSWVTGQLTRACVRLRISDGMERGSFGNTPLNYFLVLAGAGLAWAWFFGADSII